MKKVIAIIPAAGSGKRLGYKVPKPYIKLRNKPLLAYSLESFARTGEVDGIIISAAVKY